MLAAASVSDGLIPVKLLRNLKINNLTMNYLFRPDTSAHDLNNAKIYNQNSNNLEKGELDIYL